MACSTDTLELTDLRGRPLTVKALDVISLRKRPDGSTHLIVWRQGRMPVVVISRNCYEHTLGRLRNALSLEGFSEVIGLAGADMTVGRDKA